MHVHNKNLFLFYRILQMSGSDEFDFLYLPPPTRLTVPSTPPPPRIVSVPSTPRLVSLRSSTVADVVADSSMSKRWPALAMIINNRAEIRRLVAECPVGLMNALTFDGHLDTGARSEDEDEEFDDESGDTTKHLNEQIDFMLDAAVLRLCDLMPADTVHCKLAGETWSCEPVSVHCLTDAPGDGRRYVKFTHYSIDAAPSAQKPCIFVSPNLLVPCRTMSLDVCSRRVWFCDDVAAFAQPAANAVERCFISLFVEASYLMLHVLQHYAWRKPSAETFSDALGCGGVFATADDLGYLFLDYLFEIVQHQRDERLLYRKIDHLLARFGAQRRSCRRPPVTTL